MTYREDVVSQVVAATTAASNIGGLPVLQVMKLKSTSGHNFMGKQRGIRDATNGMPGTLSHQSGSSTAKGQVMIFFVKVPYPSGTNIKVRSSSGFKWTYAFYGNGDPYDPAITTSNGMVIDGSPSTTHYVCQVKAIITVWTKNSMCSASSIPMVVAHAEMDNIQENFYNLVDETTTDTTRVQKCVQDNNCNWGNRRRRTFRELTHTICQKGNGLFACLPHQSMCNDAAIKVDKYVRQKLNDKRFKLIKDSCRL
jgi:hypothetical protein